MEEVHREDEDESTGAEKGGGRERGGEVREVKKMTQESLKGVFLLCGFIFVLLQTTQRSFFPVFLSARFSTLHRGEMRETSKKLD